MADALDEQDEPKKTSRELTNSADERPTKKIKGVSFVRYAQRNNDSVSIWKSRVTIGGKTFNLGNFDSQAEAAVAYELKAQVTIFFKVI